MKKSIILLTLGMAFLLACALIPSSTAGTTYKVSATAKCNVDTNITTASSINAGSSDVTNLTLPAKLSELNSSASYVQIDSGDVGNLTFNLTVNGVAVNTTTSILNTSMENVTFPMILTAGVTDTNTYFNMTVEIAGNNSGAVKVFLVDTSLNFTTVTIATTQTNSTKAEVKFEKTESKYSVTDNVSTNNTCSFNVTNVNLTINYTSAGYYGSPGISRDALTYSHGALNINITKYAEFSYLKRGPYVLSSSLDMTGAKYKTTLRVKAFETWGKTIDFTFYVDEHSDLFPSFDYDGVDVDWGTKSVKSGDIKTDADDYEVTIQDQKLDSGATTVYFEWTPVSAVIAPVGVGKGLIPGLSAEPVIWGMDWSTIIIGAIAIIAIIGICVAYWWHTKK